MSGFSDFADLGYFPLQDHAHGQDGTPVYVRQMIAAGRITRMTDPADAGSADETIVEYGKQDDLGTLGDIHPWMFWQTRERGARGTGSWAQAFGALAIDADGYYGSIGAQPLRDFKFKNDHRFRELDPAWPAGVSHVPRGALITVLPGTDEASQNELAVWTDPRLVAPNASGPGACGTLVVDLQPTHELCMDDAQEPGMAGRAARLQSLVRVIAVPPGRAFGDALGGGPGNTIALNFGLSGSDSIPNFGAFFGYADGSGGSGPTTGGPGSNGPITGGPGGGGPITGIGSNTPGGRGTALASSASPAQLRDTGRALSGDPSAGTGSFGGGVDDPSTEKEFEPRGFGKFSPKPVDSHAIGLMANLGASGPLTPGSTNDKHRHGTDRDGHPINAAHISTRAYYYDDADRDAPIEFGGGYPYPAPLPIPARAHLAYDGISQHGFGGQARSGLWRFWCETPDVTPDTPSTPTTGPPSTPSTPSTPPTGGPSGPPTGGPTTPTGNPTGGGLGRPITPNPGGKRFPGLPDTGPYPSPPTGGTPTGGGTPGGTPTGGGSGGQPSTPCKKPAGPITGGRGPITGGPAGPITGGPAGPTGGRPRGPTTGGRPVNVSPAWPSGGRGRGSGGGDDDPEEAAQALTRGSSAPPVDRRLFNTGESELLPASAGMPGRGQGGATPKDPRLDFDRWSGQSQVERQPEEIPGVVERIGTSEGRTALYSLFRPMAQGFAAVQFRPQMTVSGYPSFEHNPQMPAPMYIHDEQRRPQTLVMHAWGAQHNGQGDWNYAEAPEVARARGGTGDGGVVFHPPRFELEDYYGIGNGGANVEDTTSDVATTGYVLAAPGVRYALGLPNADGTLQANGVQIYQPTLATGLSITHDDVEVVHAYKNASSETIVELAQGGTKSGVLMPGGTTANRPTTAAAAGLMRWNTTTSGLEVYNGSTWAAVGGGGAGGGLITNGDYTVSTGDRILGRESGAGDIEELQVTNGLQITGGALGFLTGTKGDLLIAADASSYTVTQTTLAAVRALTPTADFLPYWTSGTTAANTALTSTGRAIIGAESTDAAQKAAGLNDEEANVDFQDFCCAGATQAGYNSTNSGTGTNVSQGWPFINATTNAVGVLMIESGTTTSGYSALHTWNNVLRINTGTAFEFAARLITETLSSASEEYRVEVGFGDNWGSSTWPTDSIVFRYDRATDGANWQCVTRSGGSEVKTDSGIAVNAGTAGTMQTLSFTVNATGSSVAFSVSDAVVATHTSRIPTNSGSLGYGAAILKSAGTTEVRVGIDWTRLKTTRTGNR